MIQDYDNLFENMLIFFVKCYLVTELPMKNQCFQFLPPLFLSICIQLIHQFRMVFSKVSGKTYQFFDYTRPNKYDKYFKTEAEKSFSVKVDGQNKMLCILFY